MERATLAGERAVVLMGALFLAVAGCQSTAKNDLATPEPLADADRVEVPEMEPVPTGPDLAPVYFGTDLATLDASAEATLADHASEILAHPEWGVVAVEGHCDERGTDAYNLALGKRRADAVKHFLVAQGVPASRLSTTSYGESSPASLGHGESSWTLNRRSELNGLDRTASIRP
jgi:peptidoglycan-associated lipoprotein